ncbi:hypothetical protein GQ600_1937 [Phytophthora cactorum]|nr:hypothetical protein GQ600_1937 [Phytophthora cactorum]
MTKKALIGVCAGAAAPPAYAGRGNILYVSLRTKEHKKESQFGPKGQRLRAHGGPRTAFQWMPVDLDARLVSLWLLLCKTKRQEAQELPPVGRPRLIGPALTLYSPSVY